MSAQRWMAGFLALVVLLGIIGSSAVVSYAEQESKAESEVNAASVPTLEPTAVPTPEPTVEPTVVPTPEPTVEPTAVPTPEPTAEPTAVPTPEPTAVPTPEPTVEPTAVPTPEPTLVPTSEPTPEVTVVPTEVPVGAEVEPEIVALQPGEAFETAYELSLGREARGDLKPDGLRAHYYRLTVNQNGKYKLSSGGRLAVKATLLEGESKRLWQASPNLVPENETEARWIERVEEYKKDTVYYLLVESARLGETGAYTLMLSPYTPPVDETPEGPVTEAPEVPEVEETPEVPVTETPEAPEAPEVEEPPEVPATETTEAPEVPEVEETPEVPATETPEASEEPEAEETPEVPVTEAPEAPEMHNDDQDAKPDIGGDIPVLSGSLVNINKKSGTMAPPNNLIAKASLPQSPNPYPNNADLWYSIYDANAVGWEVTFASDFRLESNYDFLYITDSYGNIFSFVDSSGQEINRFTGTQLAGMTVRFYASPSHPDVSTIYLRLTSDYSVNYRGFRVSAATAITKLPAPTGLEAVMVASNKVKLTWNAVYNASGYAVFRSLNREGPFVMVGLTTRTNYTYTDAANAKVVFYKVSAYRTVGAAKNYGHQSARTGTYVRGGPTVTVSQAGASRVRIQWNALSGADGYIISRATTGGYVRIGAVTGTAMSDNTVIPGRTYSYRVTAFKRYPGSGRAFQGLWSAPKTIKLTGTVKPTYRALLIGQVDYDPRDATPMPAGRYDAQHMNSMLSNLSFDGAKYSRKLQYNLSANGILSAISSTFRYAKPTDVSLFFYSGHGVTDTSSSYVGSISGINTTGNNLVTPIQLRNALDKIPGKVIVILNSCGSGTVIHRSGADGEESPVQESSEAFNDSVIAAFSAGASKSGELRKDKYIVLTAARHGQSAWMYVNKYGIFPFHLTQAGGWDADRRARIGMNADTNRNSIVTLQEAYRYVYSRVLRENTPKDQNVQVYPANSSYPLFKR